MATSSQREGGRESAPPTPSTSSTEKKPQTADNEVQKLIGRQEECPTQPQGGGRTWKQGDPKPPHLKEEEEELWTTQDKECLLGSEEPDLTKLPLTGVSLKAEDHEDQEEQHFTESQGWDSTLKQEDPQPPHVNKEQEKLWTTQEGEHELTKLPLTVVSVKTEDHEDKPLESPQLHHSRSEENRGAELPSSSSLQHMTTEADGDHCGGSQADNLLAPLSDSDDTTSHSPEDEAWHDIQEPFSSDPDWEGDMRTHTDNKHTECSKKKTGKKTGRKCVTCSVCGKSFPFKCNLTRHMLTHTGEKPFSCSICAKSFSLKCYLTRHMLTHTGEKPFGCSVCGQRFSLKEQMVLHMRKHTGENSFTCSVCGKNYSFKSSLTYHMLMHTEEKPFGCSVCGQRFFKKCLMVSHMRKHTGEKPFSCSVCDKSYSCKWSLTFHMRKHTGEKSFCCPVCGQRFPRKAFMVSHMTAHTGEKPFSCSICGKNYSYKAGLAYHMRKHTGAKHFDCSVCGEKFTRKSSMVDHMRTHTGESVCCSLCGESFSQRNRFTYHMRKHKGKKPFSCSVCGQRFSEKQESIYHTKACQEGLGSASDSQLNHNWQQKDL